MTEQEPTYITKLKNELFERIDVKIDGIMSVVATKDDIANMATKEDIKNMATKDDIANMATKDDIAQLRSEMVTKEEFNEAFYDLQDIVVTKSEFKESMDELRSEMVTKEQYIEGQKEILAHIGRYEIRAQNIERILLEDHKPRIKDLEKEVFGKGLI